MIKLGKTFVLIRMLRVLFGEFLSSVMDNCLCVYHLLLEKLLQKMCLQIKINHSRKIAIFLAKMFTLP